MKRVLTAAVLVPVVILITLKAPPWVFVSVVGLVAVLAAFEYLSIAGRFAPGLPKRTALSFVFLSFLVTTMMYAAMLEPQSWPRWLLSTLGDINLALPFLAPFLLAAIQMRTPDLKNGLSGAALAFFVMPYIALPLTMLCRVRVANEGPMLVLFLFAVVWSGDIFAYYAGRAFGRHKLAPRISPGKTWEGTWASLAGSMLVAVLFAVVSEQRSDTASTVSLFAVQSSGWLEAALVGLAVNVAAQLGDLIESMMKRGAGVKDSGSLLPGHGGILDRIDALLFAAPVMGLYVMMFMRSFGDPHSLFGR